MFILNLTPASDRPDRPRIDPFIPYLPNQGRRENNNTSSEVDSTGEHEEVSRLGRQPADENLPSIFRQAIALFQDSPEQQGLISGLFFGPRERLFDYISEQYSPEVAGSLREMEDLNRQNEIAAVLVIGSVAPDPYGPLGQLLSIVGGLRFPEAIAIALGNIAILNDLAQYLLKAAAKRGDSGPALEYASAANRDGSIPPSPNNENGDEDGNLTGTANTPIGNASGVVASALAIADEANRGRRHELTISAQIAELETQIANSTNPIEQSNLRRRLADLSAGNHIATA